MSIVYLLVFINNTSFNCDWCIQIFYEYLYRIVRNVNTQHITRAFLNITLLLGMKLWFGTNVNAHYECPYIIRIKINILKEVTKLKVRILCINHVIHSRVVWKWNFIAVSWLTLPPLSLQTSPDLRKPLQDLQVAEIWYEYEQIEKTYKSLTK